MKSYSAVGIPPSRILIIDPAGKVRRADQIGFTSSYGALATEMADHLFPHMFRASIETDEIVNPKELKLKTDFTKPEKCR